MKKRAVCVLAAFAGAALSASLPAMAEDNCSSIIPCGVAEPSEQDQRMLASVLLPLMPRMHREKIIAAGGLGSEGYTAVRDRSGALLVSHDERYERLREFVSPSLFARVADEHLDAMLHSRDRAENGHDPIAMCFAPDTDPELVSAFSELFQAEFWSGESGGDEERFQVGDRWTSTATDGFVGSAGTPITLTYSFAPDGSQADNLSGFNRSSRLFEWLDGLYGSTATWQNLFHLVFQRWGDLIGVTYVHETNDDGVEANTSTGSIGVRGDVRIFAVDLDGGGGVLAYNAFPNAGDMVFDDFDSFFSSTSNNSRRLRNVAAHEHGHGLGFFHVCPANQTKLMEPFVSTAYDGPQLDDILAGQRNYGDVLENNDNSAEATDLGSWSIGTSDAITNVSIDDNSDIDFYKINVTQPLEIVVNVAPDAGAWTQGPQTQSCNTGTFTDYEAKQDLEIQLRSSNGVTVLATENSTGMGSSEQLNFTVFSPGNYYIVVDDSTSLNSIQRYRMDIDADPVPFNGPSITAQGSVPSVLLPGTPFSIDFEILENEDTIIDGPDLLYRFDLGTYTRVPLTALGSDMYRATVPAAACGDEPQFYIEVVGDTVGAVNMPIAGAADPFAYGVGSIEAFFEDDFETVTGWNDSIATASSGSWERGVPVPSSGAPSTDFDGSGQCYVTGIAGGEDVDGGSAVLRSPSIDLSDGGTIRFAYWFSGGGAEDNLAVQYSTNGQISWTEVRTYINDSAGWLTDEIEIDEATGVSNFYFRFIVEDAGSDSLVEAAVDAIVVGELFCTEPAGCNAADIAEPFGVLDLGDINSFINGFLNQTPIADIAEPFGVFDLQDISVFISEFLGGCP